MTRAQRLREADAHPTYHCVDCYFRALELAFKNGCAEDVPSILVAARLTDDEPVNEED